MSKSPNVLIIQTDQQSSWTLGIYGGTVVSTPNLDRIGVEGAVFNNFFVNSACCTPSRGCFVTGRYPHAHGAFFNDMELNRDEITFAHLLRDHGYRTGYIGKWHLNGNRDRIEAHLPNALERIGENKMPDRKNISCWVPRERSMGFEDSRWMFECSHAKKIVEHPDGSAEIIPKEMGDEKSFTTDWICDKGNEFILQEDDRPFCLMLSIPDPHTPFSVRPPYDSMFSPDDMELPETFNPEWRPSWLETPSAIKWTRPKEGLAPEYLKKVKAQYYGQVKCIDDNVGKILSTLEEKDILDKTVIVFTTDHGEYMGEHGIMSKNQFYETAYHVPLLIRYPEIINAGTEIPQFVTAVDFQPTLLGLLDIKPSGREQGRDASVLLREKNTVWNNDAFIYGTVKNRIGIFTPEYELVYVQENKDHLLFDRINDPLQIKNLFYEPEYENVIHDLTARIIKHAESVEAPELEWLKKIVTQDS